MVAYNNNYGGNSAPATSNRSGPSGEEAWRPYSSSYYQGLDNQRRFGENEAFAGQDDEYEAIMSNLGGQSNIAGNLYSNETTPGGYNGGLNHGNGINANGGGQTGNYVAGDDAPDWANNLSGMTGSGGGTNVGTINTPTDPYGVDGDGGGGGDDYYDAIMEQLMGIISGGPRDTSAEEGLIQDYYAGKMGAGMGDLAAQFGAGGMGQSGALLGAGADLQGQLARDASRDVLGVQQGARDEFYRNLMNAVGASQAERYLGMDETQFGILYDTLMEQMGEGEGVNSGGGGGGGGGSDEPFGGSSFIQDPDSSLGHGFNLAQLLFGNEMVGGSLGLPTEASQYDLAGTVEQDGRQVGVLDAEQQYSGNPAQTVTSTSEIPGWPDVKKVDVVGNYTLYEGSDGNRYLIQGSH